MIFGTPSNRPPSINAPMGGGQMNPPYLQMRTPAKRGRFQTKPVLNNRLSGGMGDNHGPLQALMQRLAQLRMR